MMESRLYRGTCTSSSHFRHFRGLSFGVTSKIMRRVALFLAFIVVAAAVGKFNGSPKLNKEKVVSARSHELINVQDLPSDWDW